jgi:hypothetical protein
MNRSFPFIIAYAVALSLLTTNVVGYTKKTTVTAIFFVACRLHMPFQAKYNN